jgi:hypothetical protein
VKLWVLEPKAELIDFDNDADPAPDNPWVPWYDKTFRMIVRAETEVEARCLGGKEGAGDEVREWKGQNPWLDPNLSDCVPLSDDGEPGVIMVDYQEG